MRQIETDYLVVGAGASGMAFVDELIAGTDAEVVMVDRRHRPGGHWIDGYPFLRLHQPSAYYGVNSRVLGHDRVDTSGPNAGFYERATAAEVCDYYTRVLEGHMLPSGQVRFFGMSDYRGNDADGHVFVSLLTGEVTTVKVRRKVVDATYIESSIPSRHAPAFDVDADVLVVTPNDLVNLGEAASGYTVIGAGKTSMDTCVWLLEQGVSPDSIRWIRPRDAWVQDRTFLQPFEQVAAILEWQSCFVEAAAVAREGREVYLSLEAEGIFNRIDPGVEPAVFRGATLSQLELESLRRIGNVVRLGKVRRIGTDRVLLDEGSITSDPRQVFVDCSAAGLKVAPPRAIFEGDRITLQVVTLGVVPWGAATVGYVEATRDDDETKNDLCPALWLTEAGFDVLPSLHAGLRGMTARMAEPDVFAWNENARLNPARGAAERMDDPRMQEAFVRLMTNLEPAMANLERVLADASSPASV